MVQSEKMNLYLLLPSRAQISTAKSEIALTTAVLYSTPIWCLGACTVTGNADVQMINPSRRCVHNCECQGSASTAKAPMKVMTFKIKMCHIYLKTLLIGIVLQV